MNIKTEARDVVGSGERGGLTRLCDIHSILMLGNGNFGNFRTKCEMPVGSVNRERPNCSSDRRPSLKSALGFCVLRGLVPRPLLGRGRELVKQLVTGGMGELVMVDKLVL